MKRFAILSLLLTLAAPAFATTHKENYNVPCNELWRALKDTLRNSGKYGIISIADSEMTASYNIGGNLTGKRVNSAILNSKDDGKGCEMQIQTAYSGLVNNDAGDMKKRVDESLAKLKGQPLETASASSGQPAAPPAPVQASLTVDSAPAGADIEIEGAFVGNTPSTLSVALGSHQVAVKKKGYTDWTKTLSVSGGTVHLNAELEQEVPKQ
jgi:hypothetical protein